MLKPATLCDAVECYPVMAPARTLTLGNRIEEHENPAWVTFT